MTDKTDALLVLSEAKWRRANAAEAVMGEFEFLALVIRVAEQTRALQRELRDIRTRMRQLETDLSTARFEAAEYSKEAGFLAQTI